MSAVADNLIRLANKVQRRARERPVLLDVGFAVLVFVVEVIDLIANSDDPGVAREPDALAIVLVAFGASTLIFRRQRALGTLTAAAALMLVFYVRDYGSFMSVVGLASFYAAAAHAANRRHAWIAIVTTWMALFSVAAFTLLDRPSGFVYSGAASMSTYIAISVFVGVITRNREQIFMKAEARADYAEADRANAADRAATQERLRIARELHDVVAHGMSVISVQAAAAQEIAHQDPDRAVELMKTVEITGRESLDEMRRMLGVLRNGDNVERGTGTTRTPQPSLADLEAVIEHCRDAGLETEFNIVGEPRALSPGLELTIFRLVQEALTNVLKHGGTAATAKVELSYRYTTVLVRVDDTGRGLVSSVQGPGTGNGLAGMQERVDLYDGQLTYGPKAGGGYQVRAVLPFDNARRPQVVSAEAQTTGQPT